MDGYQLDCTSVAFLAFGNAEVAFHESVMVIMGGHLLSSKVITHRVLPTRQCLPTQGSRDISPAGKTGKKLAGIMPFSTAVCYLSFRSNLPGTN